MADKHPRRHADLLQRILQRQTVDHGRQHAHGIGAGAVHADLARYRAAKNIAAADHQREFAAEILDLFDFLGKCLDGIAVDAEIAGAGKHLAGHF